MCKNSTNSQGGNLEENAFLPVAIAKEKGPRQKYYNQPKYRRQGMRFR